MLSRYPRTVHTKAILASGRTGSCLAFDKGKGSIRLANLDQATRQRLAGNAVARFRIMVGVTLASRTVERQRVEALVNSQELNRMSRLGTPSFERTSLD